MSRKKNRISVDADKPLSIENPFASLSSDGLEEHTVDTDLLSAEVLDEPSTFSGRVEVRREKSGRAGKTVTTLRGFPELVSFDEMEAMAFKLKKLCACGGCLKERTIELQGDVCKRVMHELKSLGFNPVRSGG